MSAPHPTRNSLLATLWAALLAALFLLSRGHDVGRLPADFGFFFHCFSGFDALALRDGLLGALVTCGVAVAWYGFGRLLVRGPAEHPAWHIAMTCAWGAGITSLLWFVLGLLHWYYRSAAALVLGIGLLLALSLRHQAPGTRPDTPAAPEERTIFSRVLLALVVVPVLLTALAALAPPAAKDALLYHLALPKAFLAGHGLIDVPGNIAQYYALGAELNGLWGMLLGRTVDLRAGEAAFTAIAFAYLPLLLLALYGGLRQRGRGRAEALLPAALLACVPTVFTSAASGYNDLALTLYLTLAVMFAAQWWTTPNLRNALRLGLALGFALHVKLLALFLLVPVLLLLLFRLRLAEKSNAEDPRQAGAGAKDAEGNKPPDTRIESRLDTAGSRLATRDSRLIPSSAFDSPARVLQTALLALVLAAVLAAPWYVRTWARTGSPAFPFYMNVMGGQAPGWDLPRSVMDQLLNARYGGYPKGALDYLAVPLRLSLTAQPEIPRDFDGVLGISFLFGLPLLAVALRRRQLDPAEGIAGALAGGFFLFWLFSSEQMRYLLPALPALAIALGAAASALGNRSRHLLAATAGLGLLVIAAWFVRQAPLPVAMGLEPRTAYLERMVDHYSFYETANRELPTDARVWLINMRGDTYYLDRPYVYDFRIEDYTLVSLVRASSSVAELRRRMQQAGITHLLARTDVLLDYALSPVVDDRRPAAENEQNFQLLRSFLLGGQILRQDNRFLLMKVE